MRSKVGTIGAADKQDMNFAQLLTCIAIYVFTVLRDIAKLERREGLLRVYSYILL